MIRTKEERAALRMPVALEVVRDIIRDARRDKATRAALAENEQNNEGGAHDEN